jgi:hemolysin activation/secretion protein
VIKETHALPPLLDEKMNQFGTGFHALHFDNFVNPSRGYALDMKASAGERKILKNPAITRLVDASDTFHFESLYDTFPSHQWQASLEIQFSSYIPLSKSLTGKLSFDNATLFSKDILINEWYHIGGFHLLRGFDEWSIAASHYDVLSLELHYLLTPYAYAMIFSDNAYVQQRSVNENESDFPFGFGAGFQLQTKAGIFSIAAALGRSKGQELALKNAKIHIGYVNYF